MSNAILLIQMFGNIGINIKSAMVVLRIELADREEKDLVLQLRVFRICILWFHASQKVIAHSYQHV